MTDASPVRIGGWLLAPLAWLLMSLLSTTLAVALYVMGLASPQLHQALSAQGTSGVVLWYGSMLCAMAMWGYTFWLTIAFFKRRQGVPRHYIIWLLLTVLLAIKSFAFSPVSDALAVRQLLFPLLAAALLVPYFKRSVRVKQTFVRAK
ncbi:putative inner membrane protein [Cronobacter dublinensis 1210]|uniref:Inner membrane protein n=1 Tax=Cronobacter dublinensis 1210 TaxID=1208656 RepID=A0ABM9Q687_9ENTR|nr:DUF2569 domain-containing protein [Cronobacter dublinensis]ALB66658.1 hypothetical protein AFK67_09265 [Cronobacter dublinensis subsp. dublinensis LMG 23823]MDI7271350.1 DUF2569 domain-containing protein [Cronobacter dublinensis]CCJ80950.1 putative inner membrane protein [Cronobacter dublinensis 1210]